VEQLTGSKWQINVKGLEIQLEFPNVVQYNWWRSHPTPGRTASRKSTSDDRTENGASAPE